MAMKCEYVSKPQVKYFWSAYFEHEHEYEHRLRLSTERKETVSPTKIPEEPKFCEFGYPPTSRSRVER
jgi:hypothetical protein